MTDLFKIFADYNRWANAEIYKAAGDLTDSEFRQDKGAFFGSVHRTLNHILVADRIWMKRFTGIGELPKALNVVLFEDLDELAQARRQEDMRLIEWINGLHEDALKQPLTYTPLSNPMEITQPLGPVLMHVFNHQTHHRGQCHAIVTALGKPSISLDIAYFLRQEGARWVDTSIEAACL